MLIGRALRVKDSPLKKVGKSLLLFLPAGGIKWESFLESSMKYKTYGLVAIAVAVAVVVVVVFIVGRGCEKKEKPVKKNDAKAAEVKAISAKPRVEMVTSRGRIVIELEPQAAPVSVANFVAYVQAGHYDGLTFHRVIPRFMIQGGGFDAGMSQKKVNAPIVNECKNGLKNDRGTIAMARTNVLDSATSQFFINLVNNDGLNYPSNGGYAVFGKVVEGMDAVDAIAAVKTTSKMGMQDVPAESVMIQSAKVLAK
jgi:peptidyl-prolyl cis-trans isomerase A (cyclophilin A)